VLRALVVVAALLGGAVLAAAQAPVGLEGLVVRVVDGDTIHVQIGERVEKVRYIGVNTPELRHPSRGEDPGARQAQDVNRRLVERKRVRLELDVQARDRHGRLLAYVWIGDTMINAELLRLGFAQVMTVPPNVRHQALFTRLQRDARAAGRGLWGRASLRRSPWRELAGELFADQADHLQVGHVEDLEHGAGDAGVCPALEVAADFVD
jgi:micrococcal nuclease